MKVVNIHKLFGTVDSNLQENSRKQKMSEADMSRPKRPRPKCLWPKCLSTST